MDVLIGNIPTSVEENDIKRILAGVDVKSIKLGWTTRTKKRYAYVSLKSEEDTKKVVETLNGKMKFGKRLLVKKVEDVKKKKKKKKSPVIHHPPPQQIVQAPPLQTSTLPYTFPPQPVNINNVIDPNSAQLYSLLEENRNLNIRINDLTRQVKDGSDQLENVNKENKKLKQEKKNLMEDNNKMKKGIYSLLNTLPKDYFEIDQESLLLNEDEDEDDDEDEDEDEEGVVSKKRKRKTKTSENSGNLPGEPPHKRIKLE